ncbi:MAG: 5-(carboxyamino)imidazole ribonucleotide mutase [Synergistaceae bacterium]|jgi:5-(carboxyamino)imidazole ribonucleotide mutase|nr:5-(carboxyamino)imidazole ribonucleotide mutase [Synergistaceae bacterium]
MTSVGIIVGSASDLGAASKAAEVLSEFGVKFEVGVASAHRTPGDVENYARRARGRGLKVIIAMAGLSAALPGVVASRTTLPVIAVPIASGALAGADALLASTQMPPGVPVGSVGIDGAKNAALLALRILAAGDENLADALESWAGIAADRVRESRDGVEKHGMPPVPKEAYL